MIYNSKMKQKNIKFKYCFTISSVIIAAIFFTGCRSVPITGRTQLMLSTTFEENNIGISVYNEYKAKYRCSSNAEYNHALSRCGRAIAQVADRDDFDWEFIVLDTNIQNAFCLPGGKVAVYSGLMNVMNNEAELACIVAHEAAHAIARHGGEKASWRSLQTLGAIGVALGFNSETLDEIYGAGSQLGVMLPFSRKHEYEADLIGLILMARAGYNPQAAIQFWSRFSKGKNTTWVSAMTSTHPCDADRIQNFYNHMYLAEEEYRKTKNKKGFGMTFSKDVISGY